MKMFSESSRIAPNPDPSNYQIRQGQMVGKYAVVQIQYPGCTPYGGMKILVYRKTLEFLNKQTELDPHFLETGLSPIARFPSTVEGIQDAISFCEMKTRR